MMINDARMISKSNQKEQHGFRSWILWRKKCIYCSYWPLTGNGKTMLVSWCAIERKIRVFAI